MPNFDRFLISPLNSGLENNVRPFLIPNDAYTFLENAYLFRGRVRKRFGEKYLNTSSGILIDFQQLFSRLRINIGNTPTPTVPGIPLNPIAGGTSLQIGQMFSVGTDMFTITTLGAAALTLSTNPGATATINSTTNPNTVTFTGEPGGTAVFWYPTLPVMGLLNWLQPTTNYIPVFGFDTRFAYQFIAGAWQRLGTKIWSGTDYQFFWPANWRGTFSYQNLFFVTNNNAPDLIQYWNGANWNALNPVLNSGGDTLQTSLILVPFQRRLVALNNQIAISGDVRNIQTFTNLALWSALGDPGITNADSWNASVPGNGGGLYAATKQNIVSAQVIKNRLIVEFQSSTWELVYTANEAEPFKWQSLNIELGAQSTFAHIPFDKFILGIGNQGVVSCNGVNVERIDLKIPDEILAIQNDNNGQARVYGIRDYHLEMVYWTFPDFTNDPIYPTRLFIYNYRTQTWAFNDDSITCFGYFYNQPDDTWANDMGLWEDDSSLWSEGFVQANQTQVIAGNQQGYTFICDADVNDNIGALQITNITINSPTQATITSYNHNLYDGDFVQINYAQGINGLNSDISHQNYAVQPIDANNFSVVNQEVKGFVPPPLSGVYEGGGTIERVSIIDILTKQYNFYANEARNCYVAKVDFLVDSTVNGQITVDSFVSSAGGVSMILQGQQTQSLVGTGVLETTPYVLAPLESKQDRFWHAVYFQSEGEVVQLRLYLSPTQLLDPDITRSDFQLNAMLFWTLKTSLGFSNG